eukprot:1874542-Rhodomonas_salina.1
MPAQSKQCPTAVLALRSAAFLQRVQLLAGSKAATTMGDDEDIWIHLQSSTLSATFIHGDATW